MNMWKNRPKQMKGQRTTPAAKIKALAKRLSGKTRSTTDRPDVPVSV
jgi:hypothetical protein